MADSIQILQDPAIAEFKDMLKKCTLQAVCGREYVLVEKLTKWLRSKRPGSHTTYANRLLQAVYRSKSKHAPAPPIPIEILCHHKGGCLLVFSILLELGRGELAHCFQRQGIIDQNLPIDLHTLRTELGRIKTKELPDLETLADKFDRMQWRFSPTQLSLYMDREFPEKRIIPIHRKKKINCKGGTAEVWQILVLEEFVSDDLRQVVESSGFSDGRDELGYRYQFALKTFEEGHRSLYMNEKMAFDGLRQHEGMVRYLGDYGLRQAVPATNPPEPPSTGPREEVIKYTYNILLEFCDLDLDEFFYYRLPPLLEIEVEGFWTALLDVADAIEGIHNLKADTGDLVEEYRGWHADIKPDNILSVEGKFKLADPGFAKFVKTTDKDDKDPKQIVLGGTETYGAPERLLDGDEAIPVPQSIDTWSLGCVFSVAATWVVLGYQGIRQFSNMRLKAIEKLIQQRQSQPRLPNPMRKLNVGDYFHDGQEVLNDVKDWHKVLRSALRKNDRITSLVLDMVDQKMLLGTAEKRWKAKTVCAELRRILAQSQARPREHVPREIMDALIAVDQAAPSKAMGSELLEERLEDHQHLTIADARQARKSKRLDLPLMKTSHRSEGRKSALPPPVLETEPLPAISESPVEMNLPVPKEQMTPPPKFQPLSQGEDAEALQRSGHTQSPPTSPLAAHATRPALANKRRATPQDVFQAREAIGEREKHNYLKRTRKDGRLSMYYGNRDIKFLVDNAETMNPFWFEATYLLETLVMKAAGQDEDGMDLYFTHGPIKVKGGKSKSEFVGAMNNKSARPMNEVRTDMRASLGELLSGYIGEAKISGSKTRKLTIIVLTDGKWEGMGDKDDVRKLVVKFVGKVKELIGDLESRPVSIEFIQFGDDADATYRLRQLDNGLKWDGIDDIIDTEPSRGDLNKMLLGSFIWIYDDDEEEEDGEAESSIHRMGSTKSRHGTGRPARSSTLMSADQIPRTIPGVMETAPSRGHSRQNTLESAASTSPQHHNQVQQWYRP